MQLQLKRNLSDETGVKDPCAIIFDNCSMQVNRIPLPAEKDINKDT